VGRLGTYKYYNLDQIVGQSLTMYKRLKSNLNGFQSERFSKAFARGGMSRFRIDFLRTYRGIIRFC
jgi:hypothetical protein